jgi:hypothetical protein
MLEDIEEQNESWKAWSRRPDMMKMKGGIFFMLNCVCMLNKQV